MLQFVMLQVLFVWGRHEHQLEDDELRSGAERARVGRGESPAPRLLHRQGARQGDSQGQGRDDNLLGGVQGQQVNTYTQHQNNFLDF